MKKKLKNLILCCFFIVLTFVCSSANAAPGDLDAGFGDSGVAITSFGSGQAWAYASVVQPDDKIVAAGSYYNGSNWDIAVARYNADGSLDTTFGNAGKVVTAIGSDDGVNTLALQTDGKIIAAGNSVLGAADFSLVRYNADGSLDENFGIDGVVTTEIGYNNDYIHSVKTQSDGKFVAVGTTYWESHYQFAFARYEN